MIGISRLKEQQDVDSMVEPTVDRSVNLLDLMKVNLIVREMLWVNAPN